MTSTAPNAAAVAEQIEGTLPTRVLVFGSLPPDARDLDLLMRPGDEDAVMRALAKAGLAQCGRSFAVFGGCTGFAVEVTDAASWGLPRGEVEALFAEAIPLRDAGALARPHPAHALLIVARRLAWSRGRLADKLLPRVDDALEEDRAAWARARLHAPGWGLEDALHALEELHHGKPVDFEPPKRNARRRLPRARPPRPPLVVALSGLDGAGKSSHATALRETLDRLGVSAGIVWMPLGQNVTLEVIGRPIKRILGMHGSVLSHAQDRPNTTSRSAVTRVWATFVAMLNVLALRRGLMRQGLRARVVVFDRHAIDSIVRMRFLYGDAGNSRVQRWLIRRAAPRAKLTFLLDVAPELAHERKQDWTLEQLREQARFYDEESKALGARKLDASAPRETVCAEIARAVWERLG